ncbi:hypothetical protein NCS52_00724400 [Fusarium sp. LHS14.1]|nr:hypothetical protein NCS52_00724400 [Fusarium sp. LHS14.1]
MERAPLSGYLRDDIRLWVAVLLYLRTHIHPLQVTNSAVSFSLYALPYFQPCSKSAIMPASMEPTQQAPMTSDNGDIVTQQPSAEPQPEMSMRGGEEAGCEICCGLCACDEACC